MNRRCLMILSVFASCVVIAYTSMELQRRTRMGKNGFLCEHMRVSAAFTFSTEKSSHNRKRIRSSSQPRCALSREENTILFMQQPTSAFKMLQPISSTSTASSNYRRGTDGVKLFATPEDRKVELEVKRGDITKASLSSSSSSSSSSTLGSTHQDRREQRERRQKEERQDRRDRREQLRKKISELTQKMVLKPIASAAPMPKAIASVLRDATLEAVDLAVDEVMSQELPWPRRNKRISDSSTANNKNNKIELSPSPSPFKSSADSNSPEDDDLTAIIDEAFRPMDESLMEMEKALINARISLNEAKEHATHALKSIREVAIAQTEGAMNAVAVAEETAEKKIFNDLYTDDAEMDMLSLTNINDEDDSTDNYTINYQNSEIDDPFIDDNQFLIPGQAIVRVENAPENSRRIFAGIDILATVDDVWNVLTDYKNLHLVVPNLVVNEVLEEYEGVVDMSHYNFGVLEGNDEKPIDVQCMELSKKMKGALIKQVGGTKVAGINFSARTTLEVREWPYGGLPDFQHYTKEVYNGKGRNLRAKEYTKTKLQRYIFPRPFSISNVTTTDSKDLLPLARAITMQSVEKNGGEFRLYQGVWRMQPLNNNSNSPITRNRERMRLTYSVEISPRSYLPVQLIEGRIVKDFCKNLVAINDYVLSHKKLHDTMSTTNSSYEI